MKLINRYKAILNRKSNTVSKISEIKPVKLIAELLEVIMIWRTLESRWFSKTIIKLLLYIQTEIIIEFCIDYKPTLQKIKNLLKLNFKIIISILEILLKNLTFIRFFEKIYKIKVVIVFMALETLVLKYLLLDLI